MCKWLGVSRSGFYAWRARDRGACPKELALRAAIRSVHKGSRGTYGWRRVLFALRCRGIEIGRDRLQRLMREMGIRGAQKPRFRRTTDSNHDHPIAPNLLQRDFGAKAPNEVWVSDITYVRTGEGWLYLAAILDVFSRRVVGFSIQDHLRTDLVLDALDGALGGRQVQPGLIAHSDRGVQYASAAYRERLRTRGIEPSMSRKGDCWDNAVAESFFGTLKTELVHRNRWTTHTQARRAIYEYIEVFYNRQRAHSALGYLSPHEFERLHDQTAA